VTHVGLRSLWVLAFFSGSLACEGREIVVFSPAQAGSPALGGEAGAAGSAGSSAGSPGAAGSGGSLASGGEGGDTVDQPCQTTDDCDPSWYCAKQSCSDAGGYCLPRPIFDEPQLRPVCGCEDHITYWNDTLRQANGISASTPGACQVAALACTSGAACGPKANGTCSLQLPDPNACAMPGTGQCWVIPHDCAATSDKAAWLACPPPGQPGPPPTCLTTCEAMQAGSPYVRAPKDFHCQ
jgi:hypothetical protein